MAALNMAETTQLRDTRAVLEYVLKHGFDPTQADPDKLNPQQAYTKVRLKSSLDAVKTITAMKGHYPK